MAPTRRSFLAQSVGALGAMAILPELSYSRAKNAAKLNIGLIGAGRQGRAIIAELQKMENVSIIAVCDSEESRASGGARRAAGSTAYTSHTAMLSAAKDLQAVVIATPTHLHTQIALDCIAAGKHVYCEAPLAHTPEDCRKIAAAASAAKSLFAVGLEGRSNPVYQLARTFYRTDSVRDAISIEAQSFQKTTWRFPAPNADREKEVNWRLDPAISLGLPGEMGVHQFDVAFWYTDSYPSSIRSTGSVRFHKDGRTVPDTIATEMLLKDNLRFNYLASLANSHGGRYELFRGSNAAIKLGWSHGWMFKEADAPTQGWEVYANRQQFHNDEGITLIAGATKLAEQGKLKEGVGLPHPSVYYSLWDFMLSCTEGKPVVADAGLGARATIAAILAQQSLIEGKTIEITPDMLKI